MFKIKRMYVDTFRVFARGERDSYAFRELAYIDVDVQVKIEDMISTERMTLGFYRSAGINSGKIKGQWYPIIGIKETEGDFWEFTDGVNLVLNRTVGEAGKGWLIKNLFFREPGNPELKQLGERGYSFTSLAPALKKISTKLYSLYESGSYHRYKDLTDDRLAVYNDWLYNAATLHGNQYSQCQLMHVYVVQIVSELRAKA